MVNVDEEAEQKERIRLGRCDAGRYFKLLILEIRLRTKT